MQKLLFDAIELSNEIRQALADMGFEEATPIQSLAIPKVLAGHDIIGQAQTGTGKTAAFGIPILQKLDTHLRKTQALILCPTRELAIQVSEEIRRLAARMRTVSIVPVYGGQPIERQLIALKQGAQIVVGTPGRIMDHLERGTLRLDLVRFLVLDEADEMLDMGFIEDIEKILQTVPPERQTLLFSATMPKPILQITHKYQRDPQHLSVVHEKMTVPLIEQAYLEVRGNQKLDALSRLLDVLNPDLSLVFCNTKKGVDDLVTALRARGTQCEALHGDLKQIQRDRVMNRFRKGHFEVLVATDVAARGIDVENIDIVFNYDMPWDEEDYVHRIGRTARAGKSGKAYTFVSGRDVRKLWDIQKFTGVRITREQVPSVSDVEESRSSAFLDSVREALEKGVADRHLRLAERLSEGDASSLEVIAALAGMVMKDGGHSETVGDFEPIGRDEPGSKVTLVLAVGRKHKVKPGDIVGSIAGETGIPGKSIGAIRIQDNETFVDVPAEHQEMIIGIMATRRIRGQNPRPRVAAPGEYQEDSFESHFKGGKPAHGGHFKAEHKGDFKKPYKKKKY